MTHAGESYGAVGEQALAAFAEQERAAVVNAAGMLRDAGLPCPVVSVGSSPTSHFARNLDGVTEVRAGVSVLFDLVMAGIGVCTLYNIALSVLTTVIGLIGSAPVCTTVTNVLLFSLLLLDTTKQYHIHH